MANLYLLLLVDRIVWVPHGEAQASGGATKPWWWSCEENVAGGFDFLIFLVGLRLAQFFVFVDFCCSVFLVFCVLLCFLHCFSWFVWCHACSFIKSLPRAVKVTANFNLLSAPVRLICQSASTWFNINRFPQRIPTKTLHLLDTSYPSWSPCASRPGESHRFPNGFSMFFV